MEFLLANRASSDELRRGCVVAGAVGALVGVVDVSMEFRFNLGSTFLSFFSFFSLSFFSFSNRFFSSFRSFFTFLLFVSDAERVSADEEGVFVVLVVVVGTGGGGVGSRGGGGKSL